MPLIAARGPSKPLGRFRSFAATRCFPPAGTDRIRRREDLWLPLPARHRVSVQLPRACLIPQAGPDRGNFSRTPRHRVQTIAQVEMQDRSHMSQGCLGHHAIAQLSMSTCLGVNAHVAALTTLT
jgi:hypothetical protein